MIFSAIALQEEVTSIYSEMLDNLKKKAVKTASEPQAYIQVKEYSENRRKSKKLTRSQLKTGARLTVTHQETVAQNQEVNQQVQQDYAQDVALGVDRAVNFTTATHLALEYKADLYRFCKKLEFIAKKKLAKVVNNEKLLEQAGYLTQFYLKNHSRSRFYEQLANDGNFRLQRAANLFGYALVAAKNAANSLKTVTLPRDSFDFFEDSIADELAKNIESVKDGLPKRHLVFYEMFFWGRVLSDGISNLNTAVFKPALPRIFSKQYYLSQSQAVGGETANHAAPFHYFILLREEDLEPLAAEKREELIQSAKQLLKLYQPHPPLNQQQIRDLEERLVCLVRFYFPNHAQDIQRLEQFIADFAEHNEDNIKILLHIFISKHKQQFEVFFKLLDCFAQRSLLDYFYKTHFQYALTAAEVEEQLAFPFHSNFIKLAFETPVVKSAKDWPDYVKLGQHLLLYAAKNNLEHNCYYLPQYESFWKRLALKFLAYTGNQEPEAKKLLNNLAAQLADDDGLSIGPVSELKTFFTGLENLLDNAMAKHSLHEQIEEIQGISLLAMDSPYACEWNGFRVISSEMRIRSSLINPFTKTYAVSQQELLRAISEHRPGDDNLKMAVFRCLGTERLREDLVFYRKLYLAMTNRVQEDDAIALWLAQILWAYYVATSTGANYKCDLDEKLFSANFSYFLQERRLGKKFPAALITACLANLFTQLFQLKTNQQNGVHSLWSIWYEQGISAFARQNRPIAEIFLRKIPVKGLGLFLLRQRKNLEQELPSLSGDSRVAIALIAHWCNDFNLSAEQKASVKWYLETLYPTMGMSALLQHIPKITSLLQSMSTVFQADPKSLLSLTLDNLIEKNNNSDAFIGLIELLATHLARNAHQTAKQRAVTRFVLALGKWPQVYQTLSESKLLMDWLLDTFLTTTNHDNVDLLFKISDRLLILGSEEAYRILRGLIPLLGSHEGRQFLSEHSLTVTQYCDVIQFINLVQPSSLALKLLQGFYKEEANYMLSDLNALLTEKMPDEIPCLLILAQAIAKLTGRPLLHELERVKNHPIAALKKLSQLHNLKTITHEELLALIDKPSLNEELAVFQLKKYRENRQRYDYDPQFVKEKIQAIKLKSHKTDEDLFLSEEEQGNLWRDYQLLMSYMVEKPIKLKIQGVVKELCINELDEDQFQAFFKALQTEIKQGKNRHPNQLLLIALSAEALYRTTNTYPRCTQILTLLQYLYYPQNIIHEMKTGEGKSIVAAMHAALLCGLGRTVDIATENSQLAKNALKKFKPFYRYLGIPCGENIITAQSEHHEYVANGVNHSTAPDLALFQTRMALDKKELPNNPSLIADEVDATLTATVQFRLAAALDPLLLDTHSWTQLYQLLIQFVQEEEVFINNFCSPQEDILNLKNYFVANNSSKEFLDFTNKLSDELLEELIESAKVALALDPGEEYRVVEIEKQAKKQCYVAPLNKISNRPEPTISYSDHVQQLLHTLHNNKNPSPKYPLAIEPCAETLVATSSKNFFDYYRKKGGTVVGLTGTAGSILERAEFYEQQGFIAFNYPTFFPDLAEDLGLITVFETEKQYKTIIEWIENHKKKHPQQPILLITPSPQVTETLCDLLDGKDWKIQSFHGYEENGKSEEAIIDTAGKKYFLTIANQSLARGADIDPEDEEGLLVINACTDLTSSELRQIQGRAARNGKRGQFISIINAQPIANPSDTEESLAAAFKQHQHDLSLKQQQERSKLRLLEEVNYLILFEFVFKLRETADKILLRQFGEGSSIVEHKKLLSSLNTLNRNAEKHYAELRAQQQQQLDDASINSFLTARINDYQQILDNWLPQGKFNHIEVIEPSIPLEALKKLSPQFPETMIKQFIFSADIINHLWKVAGHQHTKLYFDGAELLMTLFEPYLQNKCTFKKTLGQIFEAKKLINPERIAELGTSIQTNVIEMLEYATLIPVLGRFIPTETIKDFVIDYLNTSKTQILERKWDELSLPTINFSAVSSWLNQVSTALTAGLIMRGPIPFIVNQFIVPTIVGWIKSKLKQQFSESDSLLAQLLVGIDDIANELPEAIKEFINLCQGKAVKLGVLLDKFGPLVKNKALLLGLSKYLELTKNSQYIPFVEAVPEIVDILDNYRDCYPKELVNVGHLMLFLQQLSHSQLFLKALGNNTYKESFQNLAQLDSGFITQIRQLSLPEFLNLLKVIAHPNFFSLLTKLPPETSCQQLCKWLENVPEELSEESKLALKEMFDYQNNRERLAEESKQALLNLRLTYALSVEQLKESLRKLKPQPIKQLTVEEKTTSLLVTPEASIRPAFGLIHGIVLLIAIPFLVYSLCFLSISAALIGLSLIGLVVYPFLYQKVSHCFAAKQELSVEVTQEQQCSSPIEETVLVLSYQDKKTAEQDCLPQQRTPAWREGKSSITAADYGFFDGKNKQIGRGVNINERHVIVEQGSKGSEPLCC